MRTITTVEELRAIYGQPGERSVLKEVPALTHAYRAFVEAAPFVVMATSGAEGLDSSPKGDAPGFVHILDDKTLAIPDRPGNNRVDNLRNIVEDPRISLLFMIPGVKETLRVNGRAAITVDDDLRASFTVQGKLPRSVILITIDAVYFHCAKAIMRSNLWDHDAQIDPSQLPTGGEILTEITNGNIDGEAYDRELPERLKSTLY
jgi:PPOX class probable FMN-dependent enzyme